MKLGIYGYGNIGRGVETALLQNKDIELVGIFTRRDKSKVTSILNNKVFNANEINDFKDKIDVLAICGGSATELPTMTPELAKNFNVIDTFDTHANTLTHFNNVDKAAKEGNHTAIISCGWDPGMFSLNRLYANAILPQGIDYTFWGRGVSQGHSEAIRHIKGVVNAIQYTVPVEKNVERIKAGETPELTVRDKHIRECYVVVEPDADKNKIENEIKNMPHYFDEYDTIVNFITLDELKEKHSGMPHGGFVIRTGKTGKDNEHKHTISYNLKLDSNPEFTAQVVVAFARALKKEYDRGVRGCLTVFDIRP
ncbi:MAG: diaminopimelate dehydrogenase, partial [Lachnospiraceae bacterium]|nr:diaminopimelate dehydrogenase [Lachnospiraceae bacterium]